jgi:hypothetical protein
VADDDEEEEEAGAIAAAESRGGREAVGPTIVPASVHRGVKLVSQPGGRKHAAQERRLTCEVGQRRAGRGGAGREEEGNAGGGRLAAGRRVAE